MTAGCLAVFASAQTASTATHPAAKKTAPKATAAKSTVAKSTASKSAAAQSTATKTTAAKTGTAKTGASKTGARTTSKTASGKSKKQTVAVRRPVTQQQPTTDRYKEIQQALAEKGYFSGPLDGNWGPDSTEALKRFQREQNLDADGKIGALSLMALGLGPRRGTASAPGVKAPEGNAGVIPGSTTTDVAMPADPPPVAQPEP